MTNLASETDSNFAEDHDGEQQPGLLTLPDDKPITIYINAKKHGDDMISGFGLTRHGTFYTGGISWLSDGEYASFVTFHFLKHVTGVDCEGLPYSPVYGDKQNLCILSQAPAMYPFTVYFTTGKPHDPQIIVTPPGDPGPKA